MPTLETGEYRINLNAALQDAIDAGLSLVLTVGTKFQRLTIAVPEQEETTDAR